MTEKHEDFEQNLRKDSNEIRKDKKRIKTKAVDTEVIEICGVLGDAVNNAILGNIAEKGACSQKDLILLDAVEKESKSVIRELKECGLIEVGKDAVTLTEKGKNVLAFIDGLKAIM